MVFEIIVSMTVLHTIMLFSALMGSIYCVSVSYWLDGGTSTSYQGYDIVHTESLAAIFNRLQSADD